ncbi:hypothetical protein SDC9_175139 [bioreactor metagenome]|uniref:Uncharacterized protein n=1 Tax=bioreactor metagenome TaxID=1076179 RepID=A0A645GLW0_9ZZZZ
MVPKAETLHERGSVRLSDGVRLLSVFLIAGQKSGLRPEGPAGSKRPNRPLELGVPGHDQPRLSSFERTDDVLRL